MEIIIGILIIVCLYYLVRYIIEKRYGSVQQFLISRLAKRFAERASQHAQDGQRQSRKQQKAEPQKKKDSVSVIRDANMDKKSAEYVEYEEL